MARLCCLQCTGISNGPYCEEWHPKGATKLYKGTVRINVSQDAEGMLSLYDHTSSLSLTTSLDKDNPRDMDSQN